MSRIKIDGKEFSVKEGATILEVAIEHDIYIPTLCYYDEVSPGGKCRLCTVEIFSSKRKQPLVLSCLHRVKDGMEVVTESEGVTRARREAMKEILAKAADSRRIREVAREIGLKVPPSGEEEAACIGCGICVRICREVVGRSAIALVTRSSGGKKTQPSIQIAPARCISCGTCAYHCPTGFIGMLGRGDTRIVWSAAFR